MNESPRCPACGLVLPENRLAGLCPACTWQSLSEPEQESQSVSSAEPSAMRLPGYEILGEIARGGMGIVYRARQMDPRRSVALKMLLPRQLGSAEMAERFRLEVRALTELEHPAILPVYQVGEHGGLPYFTMKLATGGTLTERVGKYVRNWRAIAELMARLAEAVQFAHEHGVLHRDLKPGNILFDDQDRPYVSDFGLAKLADAEEELTRSVDFLGTPRYVAPEIAARSARYATTASDTYGLGAILYELLTGRPPFEAEALPALLRKIAEEEPARPSRVVAQLQSRPGPPPGPGAGQRGAERPRTESDPGSTHVSGSPVPRDLEVICLKCLAKEPGRRYAAAGDLAKDLRCWLEGRPIAARPVSGSERAWKWVLRNPVLAGLSTALVLSLLGGGLVLWRSEREARRAQSEGQGNLRDALLAQAKALGAARSMGQRWKALEVLARAASIAPSLELRNEAAATLARTDLRELLRFPALIGSAGSPVVFTSDLERYVVAEPAGGFSLRNTRDQKILANFPGTSRRPARWFSLGPHDGHLGALLDDYTLEAWSLNGKQAEFRWKGTVQQPPVVEFHPDGFSVAGFVPGEGLFLQRIDGTERRVLQATNGRAIFLRFDPAGKRLAVAREPGAVEVWDGADAPRVLWRQPLRRLVPWLAWSPDGRQLAAAADDGRGIRVFAAGSGEVDLVYSRHLLYPRQFEFDPTGRMVASIGDDWALRLWDSRSSQDLVTGVGRHRILRFSQDGKRLTTAPSDGELAVLELAPQNVFREFTGTAPESEITSSGLAHSGDGHLLLVTKPYLHLYDTAAGTELAVLQPAGGLGGCSAFFESNNSAIFYSCRDRGLYRRALLWQTNGTRSGGGLDWGEERLIGRHPRGLISDCIQSGQTWVCQRSQGLELWLHRDPGQVHQVGARGTPENLAVSQDARWVAIADGGHNQVTIWDCAADRVVTNLPAQIPDRVWFSPDNGWVVASVENGYCTWSTATWQRGVSWKARLDSGDPGELSFSNDSRRLAARQEREIFRLLSFPDGRELATLKPPLVLPIRSACLRGDGQRLWLLSSGFRVFEWNLDELRVQLAKLALDWPR